MSTSTTDNVPLRWPGAVVVGGGVTGLLTALELDRHGLPVLVLEQDALCSGQTGQCHGWLHRGGVFADTEPAELRLLDEGADRWDDLVRRAGATGSGWVCALGGQREATRRGVAGVWDRLARWYAAEPAPPAGCSWTLSGPESAIVPVDVLRAVLSASGVVMRGGRVKALQPGSDRGIARAVLVQAGARSLSIAADTFVLAAGASLLELLPDPVVAADLTHRLSFMLVVTAPGLPETGLAVPEQDALGLFVVPRRRGGSVALLISNFMSYAPDTDISHAQANWLAGIAPTVATFLPKVWTDVSARWGVYPATKAEPARDVVLGVPGPAIWPTAYANVWAGVPGKLVLAPILAERLAALVLDGRPPAVAESSLAGGDLVLSLPAVSWGPEEWEVTPLLRRETLFDGNH